MSDDRKDSDDPAHQTMPPELRPFARPVPPQRLVAPENEATFKAAIDALKLLNGGPDADPFYVDPRNDPAFAGQKPPESVTAYASTVLPVAEATVRAAAPARVVIADPDAPRIVRDPVEEIDIRPFQGVRRAVRERAQGDNPPVAPGDDVTGDEVTRSVREQPSEMAANPWAKEAVAEDVRGSALPSSHAPREAPPGEDDDDTVATRPAPRGRWRAIVFAVVAACVALLVWALGRGRPVENGGRAPMPAATSAAPAAPALPSPPPSTSVEPPPAPTSADRPQAPAPPAPTAAAPSARPRVAPKATSAAHDPSNDAAVKPPPAVTTSAPAAPPSVTAVTPPPAPTPIKNPVEGDRVFGN